MLFLKKWLLIIFICFFLLECYTYLLKSFSYTKIDSLNYSNFEVKTTPLEKIPSAPPAHINIPPQPIIQTQQTIPSIGWKAIRRKDNFNNELQYYTPDNIQIKENTIAITARQELLQDKQYTSGLIESTDAYLYGYFEFTITPPIGEGLFPAIWLLPYTDKPLPEIDIFEIIGSDPYNFNGVIHFEDQGKQKRDFFTHTVLPKDTYTVALNWTPNKLSWFIDNELIYETLLGVPQEYMYILINLAVGGNWPGAPTSETKFPNTFTIHSMDLSFQSIKRREY